MELAAENGQHIHASQGFSLEKDGDVLAAYLDTLGLIDGKRGGLVDGFLQHGSEAEELAVAGLIDQDLLVILIDGGDVHLAGHQDVGVLAGVTDLVDTLPGSEFLQLDLGGQNCEFVIVEQSKKRDVF
jgi:hypothetical protein